MDTEEGNEFCFELSEYTKVRKCLEESYIL